MTMRMRRSREQDNDPNEVIRPTCPVCGEPDMVLVNGRFGEFWGCKNYRVDGCRGSVNVTKPPPKKRIITDVRPKGKRETRHAIHTLAAQEYEDLKGPMAKRGITLIEFQPGIHYRIMDGNRHCSVDYKPSTGKVAFKNGPSSPKGALSYLDGHTIQWVCDNLDVAASLARNQVALNSLPDVSATSEESDQPTNVDAEFRSMFEDAPF